VIPAARCLPAWLSRNVSIKPAISSALSSRAKGEMPSVEQVVFQVLDVTLVRFRATRPEDSIVLAPDDEHGRLGGPKGLLPFRIQKRVRAIIQEEVKLNVLIARAIQFGRVQRPGVRANRAGVPYAGEVLALITIGREYAFGARSGTASQSVGISFFRSGVCSERPRCVLIKLAKSA